MGGEKFGHFFFEWIVNSCPTSEDSFSKKCHPHKHVRGASELLEASLPGGGISGRGGGASNIIG